MKGAPKMGWGNQAKFKGEAQSGVGKSLNINWGNKLRKGNKFILYEGEPGANRTRRRGESATARGEAEAEEGGNGKLLGSS